MKLELSDIIENCTLLFADIAGFTAYSSSVSPEQVVRMLRSLMTEFDKEALRHNVYKVYTIGGKFLFILDCYVVMGLNNLNNRQPA